MMTFYIEMSNHQIITFDRKGDNVEVRILENKKSDKVIARAKESAKSIKMLTAMCS